MTDFTHYPKIHSPNNTPQTQCVAFEKLDGTNLSALWLRGAGFGALRTRCGEPVSPDDSNLCGAIPLLAEGTPRWRNLDTALSRGLAVDTACVFFEFLTPGSFAGLHNMTGPFYLIAIDVATEEGLLDPFAFLRLFAGSEVPVPRVLYRGKFTGRLAQDVRSNKFGVLEGAVIKGAERGKVWMTKVKTETWETRLKETFKDGKWKAADSIMRTVAEDS